MLVGYARTSTLEQEAGLEAQERDLTSLGCERIFAEQVSSVARRPELEAAVAYVRKGDTLIVSKLDRLARSVADLLSLVGRLEAKGVALRVLSMGGQAVDTGTATGKLMLTMLGAVAEFERSLMLERQREGIARAKGEGKYKGRPPTAKSQAATIRKLRAEGARVPEIAAQLGIGVSSVFRVLASEGQGGRETPGPRPYRATAGGGGAEAGDRGRDG